MAPPDDEERCSALTREGNRCARRATEGRFCFQHDQSNQTVDDVDPDSGRFQCGWEGCSRTTSAGYTIQERDRSYDSDLAQHLSGPVCRVHYVLAICDDMGGVIIGIFALGAMFATGLYGPTLPLPILGQLLSALGFIVGLVVGSYLWKGVVKGVAHAL